MDKSRKRIDMRPANWGETHIQGSSKEKKYPVKMSKDIIKRYKGGKEISPYEEIIMERRGHEQ